MRTAVEPAVADAGQRLAHLPERPQAVTGRLDLAETRTWVDAFLPAGHRYDAALRRGAWLIEPEAESAMLWTAARVLYGAPL